MYYFKYVHYVLFFMAKAKKSTLNMEYPFFPSFLVLIYTVLHHLLLNFFMKTHSSLAAGRCFHKKRYDPCDWSEGFSYCFEYKTKNRKQSKFKYSTSSNTMCCLDGNFKPNGEVSFDLVLHCNWSCSLKGLEQKLFFGSLFTHFFFPLPNYHVPSQ